MNERISELVQTLLLAIDEGVCIFDHAYQLIAWNERYLEMGLTSPKYLQYGFSLEENYLLLAQAGVLGEGDPQEIVALRMKGIRERTAPGVEDLRNKEGRIIEVRRYFLSDQGVAAIFSDVTADRQTNTQNQHVDLMKQLSRVTGGLAHDVNNHLCVIMGSLEMAQNYVQDVEGQEQLEIAHEAALQCASLTKAVLSLSGPAAENPESFAVGKALRDTASFLKKVLPDNVTLTLQCPEEDGWIQTDRTRFTSMLLNLALNGRDAMQDGGELALATGIDEGHVVITVRDQGCGIPQELISRVTEPYFTTKGKDGTGLGLFEAKSYLTDMGGRMKIDSLVDVGTTITLELPLAKPRISKAS